MTTPRQIAANQVNARASTGPRTARGKARAAQNARGHGLSVPISADLHLSQAAATLARAIAGSDADPHRFELAGRVAEAQIDFQRIRQARPALIAAALNNPVYEAPLIVRQQLLKFQRYLRSGGLLTPFLKDVAERLIPEPVEGPHRLAVVIANLARPLAAMDRYERRALSRRKAAIRAFNDCVGFRADGCLPRG